MSQNADNSLAEALRREEKSFLIQHYARLLLEKVKASEDLDDKIVESLWVARAYADADLALRITNLLALYGRDTPLVSANSTLLAAEEATPFLADPDEDGKERYSPNDNGGEENDADLFADEDALEGTYYETEDAESLLTVDRNDYKVFEKEDEFTFLVADEEDVTESNELFAEDEEESANDIDLVGEDLEVSNVADMKDDLFTEDAGVTNEADEETPGFAPTQGHEVEETPGFDAPEVEEKKSKIGQRKKLADMQKKKEAKCREASKDKERKKKGTKTNAQEENKSSHAKHTTKGKKEVMERMTKAKEKLKRRKKNRKEEEHEEVEEESNTADLLSNITYRVSLDDIETRLGIKTIPEDRKRLDRELAHKIRDPSIRALLEGATDEGVTLAMLPRLPRFIREGQLFQVNGINLIRSYPQFFENAQKIVLKLRTEAFFLQQSPELDWAIVTTETLDNSLQKTYMQQKQALKAHAQRYKAAERRVNRRNMIDVLYDLVIIKLVHGVNMLSETVDLTESKIGRQNFAFINYGENGIRINDIGRQQTHPQLGVCPNW